MMHAETGRRDHDAPRRFHREAGRPSRVRSGLDPVPLRRHCPRARLATHSSLSKADVAAALGAPTVTVAGFGSLAARTRATRWGAIRAPASPSPPPPPGAVLRGRRGPFATRSAHSGPSPVDSHPALVAVPWEQYRRAFSMAPPRRVTAGPRKRQDACIRRHSVWRPAWEPQLRRFARTAAPVERGRPAATAERGAGARRRVYTRAGTPTPLRASPLVGSAQTRTMREPKRRPELRRRSSR